MLRKEFGGRSLCAHLEQHVGEIAVGELEMSLIVELQQRRAVRVLIFQVKVMNLRLLRRVTTFLAHVHLCASLLVRVLMLNAVNLEAVTLEGTPLGEALLAQIALVRSNAGMRPGVPLQVERVVETLAAERAQVTFHVAVAFHVTIQQPLQAEVFAAHATRETVRIVVLARRRSSCPLFVAISRRLSLTLDRQRIFNSVTAIDELQLAVTRQTQPLL